MIYMVTFSDCDHKSHGMSHVQTQTVKSGKWNWAGHLTRRTDDGWTTALLFSTETYNTRDWKLHEISYYHAATRFFEIKCDKYNNLFFSLHSLTGFEAYGMKSAIFNFNRLLSLST
ncbi:hypothetical protein GQR58_022187 [Nymphon striatum]|nr:hypothetical protein GQR58_022187 [Nymphon striatum]